MPLFILCVGDIARFRIGLCFMTLHVLFLITQSSWSSNSTGCLEWKRTFSNSNVKDDTPHQGKNFQTELIIDVIEDDILLDNRTGWIHEEHGTEMNNTILGIGSTLTIHECH
jgi:hypothetical protein